MHLLGTQNFFSMERLNSLTLRSSFRDRDKPAKYKDMQTTRFQVSLSKCFDICEMTK